MTTRNQFATLVIAIAATSLAADAGAITVDANIHDITANTTQDYVFTDTFGSITLRGVYTPTNNGVAAGNFTSLDGVAQPPAGRNGHPGADRPARQTRRRADLLPQRQDQADQRIVPRCVDAV